MEINRAGSFKQITQGASQIKPKETGSGEIKDQVDIGGQRPEVPVGQHKKWLFMNYIAADCNLKEFQAGNIDNQELVGSDKNTHIVAMIDLGPSPQAEGKTEKNSLLSWSGGRTYYVNQDSEQGKINSPVIAEHGPNINMVDPKTLTNFIIDTVKKFPADNVALIMNDHGGGFTGAMSDDSNGSGSMKMPEISQALAEAEKVTGKKIDILGFDACLMADTQAAYEFKDNAKILLASEETEAGPGWTYQPMMTDKMGDAITMLQDAMTKRINVSPEEFAKIVVKVNEEHQKDIATFSATDLSKMGDLAKATDNLAKAIMKTDEKAAVKEAMMKAENYGGGWAPYNDMHDLHHMADLIEKGVTDPALKDAAKAVKKSLTEAVIANEADPEKYPNSKGLHIYAPKNGDMGGDYAELKFAKDTQWDEAVSSLGNINVPNSGGSGGSGGYENYAVFNPVTGQPNVWPDGSPRKS